MLGKNVTEKAFDLFLRIAKRVLANSNHFVFVAVGPRGDVDPLSLPIDSGFFDIDQSSMVDLWMHASDTFLSPIKRGGFWCGHFEALITKCNIVVGHLPGITDELAAFSSPAICVLDTNQPEQFVDSSYSYLINNPLRSQLFLQMLLWPTCPNYL